MKRIGRRGLSRGNALIAILFLAFGSVPAIAQQADPDPLAMLTRAANRIVRLTQAYFAEMGPPGTPVPVLQTPDLQRAVVGHRGQTEKLKACMGDVAARLQLLPPDKTTRGQAFDARFDGDIREGFKQKLADKKPILGGLWIKFTDCRFDNLLFTTSREIACCEGLMETVLTSEPLLQPVLTFTRELETITRDLAVVRAWANDRAIERGKEILRRYERKLVAGFPGMPWEYMFNIFSTSGGPSPHQIIWAHFNLGFEDGVQVTPGDNRIQPVLTLQGLGYNRYFLSKDKGVWRKLNYLGVAGIITLNGRKGVTAVRYGGVVHFGNYVSVGSTYGDGAWRVYASSNKVVDQVLRIWN